MTKEQWQSKLALHQVAVGERAADGKVYFSLVDSQSNESVWLSFTGEKVTKPGVIGSEGWLFIVLAILLWGYTIRFLNSQLVFPIILLADHQSEVRINNDSSQRLNHRSRGDMRRLYDEFNALVAHVEEYTDELKISSYTDGLTNVGNQRLFAEKLDTYWSLGLRSKKSLCILHFDIDYFKQYNDHYGHQKGNELLIDIARHMLRIFCRESDVVARVGGDEFAVLLFDIDLATAQKLAIALQKRIAAEKYKHPAKQSVGFATLSGGVAGVIPGKKLTAEKLMRQSDQALYRAKAAGRNGVQVYHPSDA
jgi:diguanylate cyclase (GGDEF)-like protein